MLSTSRPHRCSAPLRSDPRSRQRCLSLSRTILLPSALLPDFFASCTATPARATSNLSSSVVPEPAKKLASRTRRVAVANARRLIPVLAASWRTKKSLRPGGGIFRQLSRRSLWLVLCRYCRCIRLRFGSLGIRLCWRGVRLRLGLGIWLRFWLRCDAHQLYLKDQR
jgi:hypothetical protein